jgi:glycerol uptake facilitator protein
VDASLTTRLAAEFIGTAIMIIFGNGAVANVELKGTKGFSSDWFLIAFGYGCGVMIPAVMFGSISGNHLNPAVTLSFAVMGLFPWENVLPYIIVQFLGAMVGQLLLVAAYKPYYDRTTNQEGILGSFVTIDAAHSRMNGFVNEFLGTLILVFGALAIGAGKFGAAGHIVVGLLVMTLVASLGGPTGPALNPARDLGPRLVHMLTPLKNKGDSQWSYAWVPVVAPIIGAICGAGIYQIIFA